MSVPLSTYRPRADEAGAARTLGRAFATDPSIEYLLGAGAALPRVTWIMRQALRASVAEAGGDFVTLARDADGVAGVAAWIPPERDPIPSFPRHLRLGGWAFPWRAGVGPLPRVLRRDADAARRYREDLDQPEWILDLLGVDPARQGTGVGRALVQHGLERAAADGLPVYLQTFRLENVSWYATLGFALVSDGAGPGVPHGWGLRWTPRG